MRLHFRFLKEYRKVLRLRVNAAEDLLLNGKRAPTHRGVCQHLLAKIDRARVVGATQQLEPVGIRVEVRPVPVETLPRWQAKNKRFVDLRQR